MGLNRLFRWSRWCRNNFKPAQYLTIQYANCWMPTDSLRTSGLSFAGRALSEGSGKPTVLGRITGETMIEQWGQELRIKPYVCQSNASLAYRANIASIDTRSLRHIVLLQKCILYCDSPLSYESILSRASAQCLEHTQNLAFKKCVQSAQFAGTSVQYNRALTNHHV